MAAVVAVAPPVQATTVFQYFISRGTTNIIQPDGALNVVSKYIDMAYSILITLSLKLDNAYHILDQFL